MLGLFPGVEAPIEILVLHVRVSFELGEGAVHGFQQDLIAPGFGRQMIPMSPQGGRRIKTWVIQDLADRRQGQTHFTVQHDLLQAQESLASVIPVAVFGHMVRFEQADVIIVMKGSDRDAGDFRRLADGMEGHGKPRCF